RNLAPPMWTDSFRIRQIRGSSTRSATSLSCLFPLQPERFVHSAIHQRRRYRFACRAPPDHGLFSPAHGCSCRRRVPECSPVLRSGRLATAKTRSRVVLVRMEPVAAEPSACRGHFIALIGSREMHGPPGTASAKRQTATEIFL